MAENQHNVLPQQQTINRETANENSNQNGNGQNRHIAKMKRTLLPGVRISLLISLVIYFAMLVVGCLGVHKCPVEENIPLFLIATGGIGLLSKLLTYLREKVSKHLPTTYLESSLYTVEFVFLILGSYWVYKEYPPSYKPEDKERYCLKTAYMFAFVYITFFYALFAAIITGFLCFLLCICLLSSQEDSEDVERQAQSSSDENAPIRTSTAQ